MSKYTEIAKKIKEADAILVGASNGLSITEGIHLFANNQAFQELFGDYQRKYGLQNLLSGMLGSWPSEAEMWGFWSRMADHYSNNYEPSKAMKDLRAIVGDKDYFVLTSNGEQHFEKAGFDDDKVFEIEGDWLHVQCAHDCHQERYDWSVLAHEMAEKQADGKVQAELIPRCPNCGGPMLPNMAAGHSFLPKAGVSERYQKFLKTYSGSNLVILELGIGWRNQLIKAPLMKLTAQEPNATYITINLGEIYITENIKEKSFGLDGYLESILNEIRFAIENRK
ncbi:MAG: NAD-dependent protein deacetylase, SIR2 family [Lachnospiraceae bacterium]|nr:NAD-dependent protein deacetylase, SIR2 family [Lachnospiraceae bacterium]